MERNDSDYQAYVAILREELVPAMGCTEPVAIAFAAAKAREVLGVQPTRVTVGCSGSIIKNVKSVIVPHTGGLKGIEAAASAGIVAGDAERQLEVLEGIRPEQVPQIHAYRENTPIEVEHLDNGYVFEIRIHVEKDTDTAEIRIVKDHVNIVRIERNGQILFDKDPGSDDTAGEVDRSIMSVQGILDFANTVEIGDVKEILDRQIRCNMAIAEEGLMRNYGANIGKVLLKYYSNTVEFRARAYAAAGSDARMNGCEMPVIINSGSGNQGITASVPVIIYARELGVSDEKLYRALCVSNLTAIHQKTRIGRLSAYCGAVNAGAGAGCGIAYMMDGSYRSITHTLVNALAIVSGIICDGAKASCAAKISAAVDAGIMGYYMFREGQQFRAGDGIVGKGVETNIINVGRLGREGMRETNEEIIDMMIGI